MPRAFLGGICAPVDNDFVVLIWRPIVRRLEKVANSGIPGFSPYLVVCDTFRAQPAEWARRA